jgi:hypothetical protein
MGAKFTIEELDELRLMLAGRAWKQKECYMNAGKLALDWPSRLVYYDGLALRGDILAGIPFDHAWVCINDKPVDVTWFINTRSQPTKDWYHVRNRIVHNAWNNKYHGKPVETERLREFLLERKRYCPVNSVSEIYAKLFVGQ